MKSEKVLARKAVQAARRKYAALSQFKLKEMGIYLGPSPSHQSIAAKIRELFPESLGGACKFDVFARFVGAGEQGKELQAKYRTARSVARKARIAKKVEEKSGLGFYETEAWKRVRYQALVLHGAACQCCGATRADGVKLHVDHIKPRSKWPSLELQLSNLQVLCEVCNMGKSNRDETDWRDPEHAEQ